MFYPFSLLLDVTQCLQFLVVNSGIPMQEEHALTASLHKAKRIERGRIQYAATESLAIHNVNTAVSVMSYFARPLNGTEI
jgi:hypothetical protein